MEKKGVDGFLDSKEARVSVLLLFSVLMVFAMTLAMSSVFVSGFKINTTFPLNNSWVSNPKVNFTFNATWNDSGTDGSPHGNKSNCTLWYVSTGGTFIWEPYYNASVGSTDFENVNLTNASRSYFNYTFKDDSADDGNFTFAIACFTYNESGADAMGRNLLNFSRNYTLQIDARGPVVNFTYAMGNTSFNTSLVTTQKINFTVNDTGYGMNWSKNWTVNLSIYLGNSLLRRFNYTMINGTQGITCNTTARANIESNDDTTKEIVMCNATYVFNANGTFRINITAYDGLLNYNTTTIFYTVDQIPPRLRNFTASINKSTVEDLLGVVGHKRPTSTPVAGTGTAAQGLTLYFLANFTDNLTRPFEANLQFLNLTSGTPTWQTINVTRDGSSHNITPSTLNDPGIANLTFVIPTDVNEFEGKNVTFRVFANDSLGNVNISSSINITIHINDTFAPRITINSSFAVGEVPFANNTNTTNTTPLISWNVTETRGMLRINVTVDRDDTIATQTVAGVDGCGKSAIYDQSVGDFKVDANKNSSFNVRAGETDVSCPLRNGTHNITITAIDAAGNLRTTFFVFNVQSGSVPGLRFLNLSHSESGGWGKTATNNSNITSRVGLGLGAAASNDSIAAQIRNLTYISSCNSSETVAFKNSTVVYPFNKSTCPAESANRTLTVTITDSAGNSNATVLGFLVDNVAPSLVVHQPTGGQSFSNVETRLNVSVLDNHQAISAIGFYLDGDDDQSAGGNVGVAGGGSGWYAMNVSAGQIGAAGLNLTFQSNGTNVTGKHTIKFKVNDSVGNAVNSSVITYVQIGPVDFRGANITIANNNLDNNVSNVSFYNYSSVGEGGRTLVTSVGNMDTTIELYMKLNKTGIASAGVESVNMNLTINFNGSAANWNRTTEVYVWLNESVSARNIGRNQTAVVLNTLFINRSFIRFLPDNNSYFGKITMGISPNTSVLGDKIELWYFADEKNLATKTNITQCAVDLTLTHSLTTGLPCWNNSEASKNRSVDIYVPHFSLVALVNNTGKPGVNMTTPSGGNHTLSMFSFNISVSSDAISCIYQINNSANVQTMTKIGDVCVGQTERFNNSLGTSAESLYNVTFNVTDSSGNLNSYIWPFNVSDTTAPNNPNASRVSVSVASTSATITIGDADASDAVRGINESFNVTVSPAPSGDNTKTFTIGNQNDFNQTQVVSLSSLTASSVYLFNVTICDYIGNCVSNFTMNFTTSAAAAAAAAAATADSGGGGGGGAAAVSAVTDSKAQVWQSVPSGSSITLDVDKSTIAVTSVAVNDVKSDLSGVELEVAALSENPVSTEAAAKVYQYFRINKKNIADADAESFKIAFRVTKAWLSENGLASADVALYRFAGSEWNELATAVASTDATYVNYEADTPGFSSFAVGVKSGVKIKEEAPEEATEGAPAEEGAPTPVEAPKPVEAPAKAPIAWVIAAVVIILGIVLIVAYQKQKKKA